MTVETMGEQKGKVAEVLEVMAADGQAPQAFSASAVVMTKCFQLPPILNHYVSTTSMRTPQACPITHLLSITFILPKELVKTYKIMSPCAGGMLPSMLIAANDHRDALPLTRITAPIVLS